MSILGRLFQRDGMAIYRRGILRFNRGEYRDAITDFESTLDGIKDPSDPYFALGRFYAAEAHAKLGLSREALGDRTQAAEEFRKALACGYHYPDLHVHLSAICDAEGDDAGAERECLAALDRNPDYHDARARLLIALANQGRSAESAAELDRLIAAGYPVPIPSAQDPARPRVDAALVESLRALVDERRRGAARLTRALESYDRGDRETAVAELRSAIRETPGYADLRCRLGTLLIESGQVRQGLEQIERAIEINPAYVEARLQAGIAFLKLGAPDDALVHLRVASEQAEAHPDVVLFLGLAHLRAGDFADASRIFGGALERSPAFHRARYCLGLVHLAQGKIREAMRLVEEACDAEPALASARMNLGFLKVRHGEPEVAATMFRAVLRKDPTDPEARLGLALALESCGSPDDARAELLLALPSNPQSPAVLSALARVDFAQGHFADAAEWCDRALDEVPKDASLQALRGSILSGMGEHEKAKVAFEAALALQPEHAEARVGHALCLLNLQHRSAGRAEMETVYRADPANPVARIFADEKLIEDL